MTSPDPADPSDPADPTDPVDPADPVGPVAEVPESRGREVTYRRAPRYKAFLASGFVLGAVVGLVVAAFGTLPDDYSAQTVDSYFAVVFGLTGALLGGAAAVMVERRRR